MEPKVTYWLNGQKKSESYLVNGIWHRTDGPAVTWWFGNGQKVYEEYWINGQQYSKEDFETSWEHQSYLFDLKVADSF